MLPGRSPPALRWAKLLDISWKEAWSEWGLIPCPTGPVRDFDISNLWLLSLSKDVFPQSIMEKGLRGSECRLKEVLSATMVRLTGGWGSNMGQPMLALYMWHVCLELIFLVTSKLAVVYSLIIQVILQNRTSSLFQNIWYRKDLLHHIPTGIITENFNIIFVNEKRKVLLASSR